METKLILSKMGAPSATSYLGNTCNQRVQLV